jgi:hypothetical protein
MWYSLFLNSATTTLSKHGLVFGAIANSMLSSRKGIHAPDSGGIAYV